METGSLFDRLRALLPMLLMLLIGMGNAMFCSTTVLPQWRTYEALASDVSEARSSLDTSEEEDNTALLQAQIEGAQDDLNQASEIFLTELQIDEVMARLYSYADMASVEISNLLFQEPTQDEDSNPFNQRVFRLQVDGEVPRLMAFVSSIREATLPTVAISNLDLRTGGREEDTLTMELVLYTSPFSSGDVLATVPEMVMPTAVPTATPPGGETIVNTSAETLVPTLAVLITEAPLVTPTTVPLIAIDRSCPGAPPTVFRVGDSAVVDFNNQGALRLLARVSGPIDTVSQAYDNQTLQILDGPVCGEWQGLNVWYWYVDNGEFAGWAAEVTGEDRFLCPADDPECS